MNNDVVNVDLELIDKALVIIKEQIIKKQDNNNKELKQLIDRLTSEEWISDENKEFVSVMDKYIDKLNILLSFYTQISSDLSKIKLELESEMKKKPKVHFEG